MQFLRALPLAGPLVGGFLVAGLVLAAPASAAEAVSVERGADVALIAGCHDCHTLGYVETDGQVDPKAALRGSPIGFLGPWGTTYPANLRITAAGADEDQWVALLQELETRPPMPWFNLHHFAEDDLRSLHRYILSLGEPGDPAPDARPPGTTPEGPYIDFLPSVPVEHGGTWQGG